MAEDEGDLGMKTRLFVAGLLAGAACAAAAPAYRDVPRQHWAFQEVEWVRTTDLIPDSQGPRFEGQKGMTRYQMAQVLSGYMRDYYSKRDSIQAELTDLKKVGASHQAEMDQLVARQQVVVERLDRGDLPPEAASVPTGEVIASAVAQADVGEEPPAASDAEAGAGAGAGGASLQDRLAAMRARIRSSREGGDARSLRQQLETGR